MNTVFKKTLLATALLAVAGAAQAATITAGTEHSVTSQYLAATDTANHTSANNFAILLGAEYVLNDTITLTFTAPLATAVTSSLTANATATLKGATFAVIAGGGVGDRTVTYRLTTLVDATTPPGVTTGVSLALPAFVFKKSDLASGVTVSFSAKTNTGGDLDTTGGNARTRSLVKVVSQFEKTAPSLSKVINVEADRKSFVGADATARLVTATFNVTTLASDAIPGPQTVFIRPVSNIKHTITGDFSWVRDDDSATAGLQPRTGVFTTTGTCGTPTWTYTATAVTLQCAAPAANTAIVIDAEANKVPNSAASTHPMLPAQSFKATSQVAFTTPAATENVLDNVDAGSWTLNGSTVVVPYMVHAYGKFNSILNVHNNGSREGAISLDVWAEDGTVVGTNIAAGTSKPGSVVSVAKPAIDALIAKGYNLNNTTKYSVRVVTNVPAKDITVNSAYADVSQTTVTRTAVANDSMVQNKTN